MGGYELAIAMDVMRGRYRADPAHPQPLPANQPVTYDFALPSVDYVVQPGHRLMVQVQSSWFPLYDRNPQTFVPNIFFAKASDYRAATQKVFTGSDGSWIGLPIVKSPLGRALGRGAQVCANASLATSRVGSRSVAQLVEHRSPKPRAVGSSPSTPASAPTVATLKGCQLVTSLKSRRGR